MNLREQHLLCLPLSLLARRAFVPPPPGVRLRRQWCSGRVGSGGSFGSAERDRRKASLRRLGRGRRGHGRAYGGCRDGFRAGGGDGRDGQRPQRTGTPRPPVIRERTSSMVKSQRTRI